MILKIFSKLDVCTVIMIVERPEWCAENSMQMQKLNRVVIIRLDVQNIFINYIWCYAMPELKLE